MKDLTFLLLFVLIILNSCAQENGVLGEKDRLSYTHKSTQKNNIVNEDCLSSDPAYSGADFFSTFEDLALEMTGVTVSASEINEFGDKAISQMKESSEFKFIERGLALSSLENMLNELISVIQNPSGIEYKIHLVEDKEVNAYTVGGHIVITTGIIERANSESTLAFIIGHEIGHNEKGHLEKSIKKLKAANDFADGSGDIGLMLQNLITPAHNQPNELDADYYGIDICIATGFDPRKGITFWEELSMDEDKNFEESFLRSHPYSVDRANCLIEYIEMNYNFN